jgi:hypothetical protein
MNNQIPRLEEWHLVGGPGGRVLVGKVYGHPRFSDGEQVTTTLVEDFNLATKRASTRNTVYDLGAPHPTFLEWTTDSKSETASEMRKAFQEARFEHTEE